MSTTLSDIPDPFSTLYERSNTVDSGYGTKTNDKLRAMKRLASHSSAKSEVEDAEPLLSKQRREKR